MARVRDGKQGPESRGTSDLVQMLIRAGFTLILLAAAGWWLYEVSRRLGTAPTKDAQGNVVVDEYQRAKDILLVVLPLVTTALGYWFGVQGKEKAETTANLAKDETNRAKDKLTAVTAVSQDPQLLARAQEQFPQAFRE